MVVPLCAIVPMLGLAFLTRYSGADAILDHVKLVWASLWSDAALLYRRELGLDPRHSAMAVVVQEIVAGERSGVAFSRHPDD